MIGVSIAAYDSLASGHFPQRAAPDYIRSADGATTR